MCANLKFVEHVAIRASAQRSGGLWRDRAKQYISPGIEGGWRCTTMDIAKLTLSMYPLGERFMVRSPTPARTTPARASGSSCMENARKNVRIDGGPIRLVCQVSDGAGRQASGSAGALPDYMRNSLPR